MTPPRASDTAPSLLVVASEYLRAQAPSTPRIVYSVPIGVAGAKAIAHHSASPRMPGVRSRMERSAACAHGLPEQLEILAVWAQTPQSGALSMGHEAAWPLTCIGCRSARAGASSG